MQVSRTVYRAALFHLSVTPFVRAAIPAASTTLNTATTQSTRLSNILFPQCARQTRTMCDSNSSHDAQAPDAQNQAQDHEGPKKPLYLPASDPSNPISNQQGEGSIKLDMSTGGTEVKLDHLGPMVVNVDGTLSQIGNWQQMSDIEKQNTLRVLGKRNQKRLEALKAKGKEEASGAA